MVTYAFGNHVPKIHPSAWIHPRADVTGNVTIRQDVYIGSGAILRGDIGEIHINAGAAILENAILQVSPGNSIRIGKNVTVSVGVALHNCEIADGAMIGIKAIVSDYAYIGEESIIAEGAAVRSRTRVESRTVFAGVPAKEIGKVTDEQAQFLRAISQVYRDLAHSYPFKLKEIPLQECIREIP